jgi:hypothetical protein
MRATRLFSSKPARDADRPDQSFIRKLYSLKIMTFIGRPRSRRERQASVNASEAPRRGTNNPFVPEDPRGADRTGRALKKSQIRNKFSAGEASSGLAIPMLEGARLSRRELKIGGERAILGTNLNPRRSGGIEI